MRGRMGYVDRVGMSGRAAFRASASSKSEAEPRRAEVGFEAFLDSGGFSDASWEFFLDELEPLLDALNHDLRCAS